MYEDIVKRSETFKNLKADILNDSLSHAYLIVGPDSVFADELCDAFLYEAIYAKNGEFEARKLRTGILPDVMYFPQEKNISVNDINYITQNGLVTPIELENKFYILNKAQTMVMQAQNKLLKILEEPPDVVRFIIKSDSKNALLPTVVSRCRLIETTPFADTETASCKRLCESKIKDKELAVALCCGNLTIIEKLITDEKNFIVFDEIMNLLRTMKHSSGVISYLNFFNTYKDYFDWALFCLQIIFGDMLKRHYDVAGRLPSEFDKIITELKDDFRPEAIADLMTELDRIRGRRKFYGNYNSIVDELLLKILEVKSKWQRL